MALGEEQSQFLLTDTLSLMFGNCIAEFMVFGPNTSEPHRIDFHRET